MLNLTIKVHLKHFFAFVILLFYLQSSYAQKEAAIWYFGNYAGLDFNSGTPVTLTNSAMFTREGCTTLSDTNGNLLFYTDGETVWNRNHQIMPNGAGLLGDYSSSQSAIIVPKPDSTNIFYIFTVDDRVEADGLNYSELDLNQDGGLGDITAIKNVPLATPVAEKLTAVAHANGRDFWVLAHHWGSDAFLAYLVTPTGVQITPVVSNIGVNIALGTGIQYTGCMKASPDGTKLATSVYGSRAELFDFDSSTGILNNTRVLRSNIEGYYGVEFSPDSQLVYISATGSRLYQYDTNAADVASSETLISDSPGIYGGLQLGIDGKIYMSIENRPFLSRIEYPNSLGLASNFVENAVDLNGRNARLGLPPFIQSFFLVNISAQNFCLGDGTEFSSNTSEPISSISWDFGDGTTATLENPTHTYISAGDYTVSVTVTTASETKTETKDITIFDIPVANTASDIELCSILPLVELNLSLKDNEILGAQSNIVYNVAYYPTLTDAQNFTNVLPSLYTNSLANETIYARAFNAGNSNCYDISSFTIEVKFAPELHTATDWTVCDSDTDGLFIFDLSQKNNEIFNGQSSSVFSIAYFETQVDADGNVNPIGPNYTNIAAQQYIFYRIQNTTHQECYEVGSFQIEVITGVTAHTPTDLNNCDDNNDGLSIFDLSAVENEVLGTQNPASLNVSFYATLIAAEQGLNPLSKTYENTNPYNETIYVRVENTANTSCYEVTSFELLVFDTPVISEVSNWQICDVVNDGVEVFDFSEKDIEILGGQSVSKFTVSYFNSQLDADSGTNAIVGAYTNTANGQSIYYRIDNKNNTNCYVTNSFTLDLFYIPQAGSPSSLVVCDSNETGISTFDLSIKDSEVLNGLDANDFSITYFSSMEEANASQNPLNKQAYINTTTQETVYARIENNGLESCFDVSSFELIVNPLPEPNLETTYVICPDSPELVIDGGDFESWTWRGEDNAILSTAQIFDVEGLGDYTLTVTQTLNGLSCEKTVYFEVVSSGAPENFTTKTDGFSDLVTVIVDATGIGEFEYSIDGNIFQGSNQFEVFPGTYTVYVRDHFLCRTLSKEIIVLGYQKFFSPNGDGNNEYWNIIGASLYPDSQLFIYDRYGKLIYQVDPTELGWDGTFNGHELPSSDYWFRYTYDYGKVFSGHFSLKR